MKIVGPETDSAAECEPIVRALSDWFRDEKSVRQYIAGIATLPTFKLYDDGGLKGFITIKPHYAEAAEIFILGVLPESHGAGLGSLLVEAAEGWLREEGYQYLQLKTLSDSVEDDYYEATRRFYARRGFVPLEEFPTLWNEHYPCLLMVKRL